MNFSLFFSRKTIEESVNKENNYQVFKLRHQTVTFLQLIQNPYSFMHGKWKIQSSDFPSPSIFNGNLGIGENSNEGEM